MSIYLTWLPQVLRDAGLRVIEFEGWQTRARSSGGFASDPLAVAWHHTASSGSSPEGDCSYMCYSADAKPIANLYVARDGEVWVLAAGATNTNGSGNSMAFSRGTVPTDSANTRVIGVEIANNGVGQNYPQGQIDAMFKVSNALNARCGNQPTDTFTHTFYAPTRKIDPSTAAAVEGPWMPRSINSSGTWDNNDVRNECQRRATGTPPPPPEDDVTEADKDEIVNRVVKQIKEQIPPLVWAEVIDSTDNDQPGKPARYYAQRTYMIVHDHLGPADPS